MAYGEKYRVYCDSQWGGNGRYVKIMQDGFSGSVTELKGGKSPVILDYPGTDADVFDPIRGSELIVTVLSITDEQLIELATAKNKEYMAILYNSTQGANEWIGWLVPDEYEEPYNQPPYDTEIVFTCGLGYLKDIPFLESSGGYDSTGTAETDGDYYRGREREIWIVSYILQKIFPLGTGYYQNLRVINNLYEDSHTISFTYSCMYQTYVEQDKYINGDGSTWSCLDVLKDILKSYGAFIIMGYAGWWIVRVRDLASIAAGNDLTYQLYNYRGNYTANYAVDDSTIVETVTGPQARSGMIGWVGHSQMVRYERAYKEARVRFNYGYRNMIQMGDFAADNWDDFWTTSSTTATRRQSGYQRPTRLTIRKKWLTIKDVITSSETDPQEYFMEITGTTAGNGAYQSFEVEGGTNQNILFAIEFMAEYTASLTALEFRMHFFLNTGSTPATDWYFLSGQLGGSSPSAPSWTNTPTDYFKMTISGGLPDSGSWETFEIPMPDIPAGGTMQVTITHANPTGGSIVSTNFRNIEMWGSYDFEPVEKEEVKVIEIDTDNIANPDPTEITLGDIVQSGNEGHFFFNAKSTDSDGDNTTDLWRSYKRGASAPEAVGSQQELIDYLLDGIVTQHGAPRQRITGRANLETRYWARFLWKETVNGDKFYLPTAMRIDLIRTEVTLSMVELPTIYDDSTPLSSQLISSWSNNDMGTFSSSGASINTVVATGSLETAESNNISYSKGEVFLIQISYSSHTGAHMDVNFGTGSFTITGSGQEELKAASTAASGSTYVELESLGVGSYTNLVITVKRIYGN